VHADFDVEIIFAFKGNQTAMNLSMQRQTTNQEDVIFPVRKNQKKILQPTSDNALTSTPNSSMINILLKGCVSNNARSERARHIK
jgi:hypothetical protein